MHLASETVEAFNYKRKNTDALFISAKNTCFEISLQLPLVSSHKLLNSFQ